MRSDLRAMLMLASAIGVSEPEWKGPESPPFSELLDAAGTGISRGSRGNKYKPHQGAKERARRMRQP